MNFAIVRPVANPRPARQALSTDPAAGFVFPAVILGIVVVGVGYLMLADSESPSERAPVYR